jgi:hypothetical protein
LYLDVRTKREEVPEVAEFQKQDVRILEGHTSEVFICAFNPKNPNLLASG